MGPNGPTIKIFVNNFLKTKLDNFLHKNPQVAELILKKYYNLKKKEKDIAGIKKLIKQKLKRLIYIIKN